MPVGRSSMLVEVYPNDRSEPGLPEAFAQSTCATKEVDDDRP